MGDWGGAPAGPDGLMAETLGVAMARRVVEILSRPLGPMTPGRTAGAPDDPEQYAADDAVFTAVLDAANECLGRFDGRPAADRWCDALLHVLQLAESGAPADGAP